MPTTVQIKNTTKSVATIVEPTGVPAKIEIKSPITEQITEKQAEQIVTDLKLLKIRMEVSDGKIIKLDIIIAPIRRIPTTIVKAVNIDSKVL